MLQLTNEAVELTFVPADGRIAVRDRRRGVTWSLDGATRRCHSGEAIGIALSGAAVSQIGGSIHEVFEAGGRRIRYTWELLDDGVQVTLDVDAGGGETGLPSIALPGSFAPDAGGLKLALPIMQGVLWDGRGDPFEQKLRQGGHEAFSMAMAGYLAERGSLLLSVEDYADWQAVIGKRSDGAAYAYACAQPSLGTMRYPRRARLLFADPGLTALCKRYRSRIQERGDWKPWREKIAERPALERLFGALMTFVGYNASELDYAAECRKLRAFGFERAFIYPVRFNHYSADFRMGGDAPIHLEDEEVRAIKDLGYDVAPWTWMFEALDDGTPERRRLYRHDSTGKPIPAWKIDDYQWYVCCSSTQAEFARASYESAMRDMTWAHFDVTATVTGNECFALDHARHPGRPMDRREDYSFLRELLGPSTNGNRIVSSEGFNDALAAAYDIGTTKLLPAWGDAAFWTVPMTLLVYHDSIVHDWWELHGYNAHAGWDHRSRFGRKVDGFPRDKAAMDALYGCPPNVFPFGRQYQWVDFEARTTRSYSVRFEDAAVQEALAAALPVARLHRRVGRLELVSHEFLSEDGAAQATAFADGTRVVANFADEDRGVDGVGRMAARSWRVV